MSLSVFHAGDMHERDVDVARVRFDLLDARDIVALSVAEISDPDLSNNLVNVNMSTRQMLPRYMCPGHLGDLRMGSEKDDYRCLTCDTAKCVGHFGHIVFTEHMLHPFAIPRIVSILSKICIQCSRYVEKRDECSECGRGRSTVSVPRTEGMPVIHVNGAPINAAAVHNILANIDRVDPEYLCSAPPQSQRLVMVNMLVPPPCIRPETSDFDDGPVRHSHLTQSLSAVIKCNKELALLLSGASGFMGAESINAARERMWTHLSVYLGCKGEYYHPSGQRLETLSDRIKGKHGRVRGNIMGKRVEFSARTVITPDPAMRPDQLGIPRCVAENLTTPIRVSNRNIALLNAVVSRPDTRNCVYSVVGHDGLVRVIKGDGRPPILSVGHVANCTLAFACSIQKVHVGFNRQPTLHKGSFMGMELVVTPETIKPVQHPDLVETQFDRGVNTFRMNTAPTTPFNADFDGDEMNIHLPQSECSQAEISGMVSLANNMRSESHCTAQVAIVQDLLLMAYVATKYDAIMLSRQEAEMIVMHVPHMCRLPVPAIVKPAPMWTMRQLLSLVFPPTFSYRWPPPASHFDDVLSGTRPSVRNGVILLGQLAKADVGPNNHGMLDSLYLHLLRPPGEASVSMSAVDLLFNMQKMLSQLVDFVGFSIGLEDMYVRSEQANADIEHIISSAPDRVYEVYFTEHPRILGMTAEQTAEMHVIQALSDVRQQVEKIVLRELGPRNALSATTKSGSKGSNVNTTQIVGLLGQQHNKDGRVELSIKRSRKFLTRKAKQLVGTAAASRFHRRSLPHFQPGDLRPDANRFVGNSLCSGLLPAEFWAHAQAGREGGIDIPNATPVAGALYRRMCKMMADCCASYTGTVMDGSNSVIQFSAYNGIGDPAKLKRYHLTLPVSRIWAHNSTVADETRAVLERYHTQLSGGNGGAAVLNIIASLMRTHAWPADDIGPGECVGPMSSDQLCVAAQLIMSSLATQLSDAVIAVVFTQRDLAAMPADRIIDTLAQAGQDAAADIFMAWYMATLCCEVAYPRRRLDWSMFAGDSAPAVDVSIQTMQPIDIAVVVLEPTDQQLVSGQWLTRHAAVSAMTDMLSSLLRDANKTLTPSVLPASNQRRRQQQQMDTPLIMLRCMLAVELAPLISSSRLTMQTVERIQATVERAAVDPGQAVGLSAAMAVCEPSTQLTLNTFSVAGQETVGLTGLPRVCELCGNGKSKQPTMVVRMQPPMPPLALATDEQKHTVKSVMDSILAVHLRDIVDSMCVYYLPGAWSPALECDAEVVAISRDIGVGLDSMDYAVVLDMDEPQLDRFMSNWMMRIGIRPDKLLAHSISMETLSERISVLYTSAHIIVSPDNAGDQHPFIYMRVPRDEEQEFVEGSEKLSAALYTTVYEKTLAPMCVSGIADMTSVCISEADVYGASASERRERETVLIAGGSSGRVFTAHPAIDPHRTTTTSISATLEYFGIEAARRMFEEEMASVMQTAGVHANAVQVSLIADAFTVRGHFAGASGESVNRPNQIFANMSYGKAVGVAFSAALAGKTDAMTSSAAGTFLGKLHQPLAARFDLHLDTGALERAPQTSWAGVGATLPGASFFDNGITASVDTGIRSQEDIDREIYNTSSPPCGAGSSPPSYAAFSPMPSYSPMLACSPASAAQYTPTYTPMAASAYASQSLLSPRGCSTGPAYASAYAPQSPAYQATAAAAYSPNYGPDALAYSPSYSPGEYSPVQTGEEQYTPTYGAWGSDEPCDNVLVFGGKG